MGLEDSRRGSVAEQSPDLHGCQGKLLPHKVDRDISGLDYSLLPLLALQVFSI